LKKINIYKSILLTKMTNNSLLEALLLFVVLIVGGIVIVVKKACQFLMRCLVFTYYVSRLLLLRWQISHYIAPIEKKHHYIKLTENSCNVLPLWLYNNIKDVVASCSNHTAILDIDARSFLIKNISLYKLVSLMNCSCGCRHIKRHEPWKYRECNCCYRHRGDIYTPLLLILLPIIVIIIIIIFL
jgi:hypothetical protein